MKEKIDLVYLWVDDTDENWVKKKNSYLNNSSDCYEDAISDCRFHNNDELKYSLRSVEKYANWINKIFIITDNQVPDWLNTENPRIRVVNHTEIIPEENLPLFNSCAIETRIPFINDLSEYFLYANDDTFFWNNVEPEFFFKDNKPICRTDKAFKKHRKYNGLYGSTILRAYKLIKEKFNPKFYSFFPHHNIDAYKKTLYLECIEEFQEEFDRTLTHRFRDSNDIQRSIISFYSLAKNKAYLKKVNRNWLKKIFNLKCDSAMYSLKGKHIPKLIKVNARLMCINDNRRTTDKDRTDLKRILEEKFNKKSSFEK